MRLCFDATRFGCGLEGAVELAHAKNLTAVEFSFAPFPTPARGAKAAGALDDKEKKYLKGVASLSKKLSVEFACLNLDYCIKPDDKKAMKKFAPMLAKLANVAQVIRCPRISITVMPGENGDWKQDLADELGEAQALLDKHGVKLLLRLSAPMEFRGQSLKKWKAMEPQDWRDLISMCPGLSLTFSPADCVWLGIDYLQILSGIAAAIDHVEAHDVEINRTMLNDSGMFGPLWWRYRLPGKGQVDWRQFVEALKLYDYKGTFSIHLEDEFINDDPEDLERSLDAGITVLAPLLKG